MSLVYKKAYRDNLKELNVPYEDSSLKSPDFFRISYLPEVLTKGKTMLKLSAHPFNLVPNTQIKIDIRDSNGNPIYFEIPDFIEDDKSRIISIWIYNDVGDLNTANGPAIITLVGTATRDKNGNSVPIQFRGKPNVRWQYKVNVDRDRSNITPIIFNPTSLPLVEPSESIETYTEIPTGSTANSTAIAVQTGSMASYLYKGSTPVITLTDGQTLNSEMVGYDFIISDFTEPPLPTTKYPNPINNESYTSSISYLISDTKVVLTKPFTTKFENRDGLVHTYNSVSEASYSISYYSTGSNTSITSSLTSFVTVKIDNLEPISGVVDRVKVFVKSLSFPDSDFELINDVSVDYTGSLTIKTPLNSRFQSEPKLIKLEYLSSIGEISRTTSISDIFVYRGSNNSVLYPFEGPSTFTPGSGTEGTGSTVIDGPSIITTAPSGSTVIDGPSIITTTPSGSTIIDGPSIIISGSWGDFQVDNLLLTASIASNILTFTKGNGDQFDLSIPSGTIVSLTSGSVYFRVSQSAHGFNLGDPVSDSGSEYTLAANNSNGILGCNGIVSYIFNTDEFELLTKGIINYSSSLSDDQWAYLGSTPGSIVTTEPTSNGIQLLYRHINDGQIYVDIGEFFFRTGSVISGTDTIPDVLAGLIPTLTDRKYSVVISTNYSGKITKIGGLLQSGSLDLNVSINNVTSSTGPITISTGSYTELSITSSNAFAIGDTLGIEISNTSASSELDFGIKFNKNIT
jgi:hypothetical protein